MTALQKKAGVGAKLLAFCGVACGIRVVLPAAMQVSVPEASSPAGTEAA